MLALSTGSLPEVLSNDLCPWDWWELHRWLSDFCDQLSLCGKRYFQLVELGFVFCFFWIQKATICVPPTPLQFKTILFLPFEFISTNCPFLNSRMEPVLSLTCFKQGLLGFSSLLGSMHSSRLWSGRKACKHKLSCRQSSASLLPIMGYLSQPEDF